MADLLAISGKSKPANDKHLKPIKAKGANGKLVTFASRKAITDLIADMQRSQARLLAGKTIVKQSGTALLDPVTHEPIKTPRAHTGSKAKGKPNNRFNVDGYR